MEKTYSAVKKPASNSSIFFNAPDGALLTVAGFALSVAQWRLAQWAYHQPSEIKQTGTDAGKSELGPLKIVPVFVSRIFVMAENNRFKPAETS